MILDFLETGIWNRIIMGILWQKNSEAVMETV